MTEEICVLFLDFVSTATQHSTRWNSSSGIVKTESIGFSQYKACFTENSITGRKLIYIDCSSLPCNFQHVKMISAHIRELLGISEALWSRSVADGPEDDMTVFLKMKSHTGQRAESVTYDQIKNICLK